MKEKGTPASDKLVPPPEALPPLKEMEDQVSRILRSGIQRWPGRAEAEKEPVAASTSDPARTRRNPQLPPVDQDPIVKAYERGRADLKRELWERFWTVVILVSMFPFTLVYALCCSCARVVGWIRNTRWEHKMQKTNPKDLEIAKRMTADAIRSQLEQERRYKAHGGRLPD